MKVIAYTTNLCQKCLPAGKRRETTNKCEVEAGCGKEGVSVNNLGNDGERTYVRGMWEKLSPREKQSKEVSRAG